MTFFYFNQLNVNCLECASVNNQKCKIRPEIINVNNDEPVFCPFSIRGNKCSGIVITSMIHMLNCVFQTLLKT